MRTLTTSTNVNQADRCQNDHFISTEGVMNAADYYGLDELKQACSAFIESCITVDTVCALLATAERYIQYKCTKVLVQKVINAVWRVQARAQFTICLFYNHSDWLKNKRKVN